MDLVVLSDKSRLLSPVVSEMIELGSALREGKDTALLIKFVLDCTCKIGSLVGNFITELHEKDLWGLDEDILKAYYDATQKCKMAAANIHQETSTSYTQLINLRGALNRIDKHGNSNDYEVVQAEALKEIKRLESPKFNLPNSLISDLKSVKAAYEGVIRLCYQKKEEAQWHIALALVVGLIVLGVCLSVPTVGLSLRVAAAAAEKGAVPLAVKVGGFLITGCTTLCLAKEIMDLIGLTNNLKQQWELLATQIQTQTHVRGLIVGISKIQTKVEVLQTDSQSTLQIAASAQRIKDLSELRDPMFRADLDQQINDLKELKLSGRQLMQNAEKAFEFFERQATTTQKNPFIVLIKAIKANIASMPFFHTFFQKSRQSQSCNYN